MIGIVKVDAGGTRFALLSEAVQQLSSGSNRFLIFCSSINIACNRSKLLNVLSPQFSTILTASQAKAAVDATEKARIIGDLRTKVRKDIQTKRWHWCCTDRCNYDLIGKC